MDKIMEAMGLIEDANEGSGELFKKLEQLESETPDEHADKWGDIWEAYIAKFGV